MAYAQTSPVSPNLVSSLYVINVAVAIHTAAIGSLVSTVATDTCTSITASEWSHNNT